jgi:AhpD family alkylhydroperoxidase
MQTLKAVDPATAAERTRELLGGAEQRLGRSSNMMRVMANSPTILAAYLQFNHAFQETKMTGPLRALITTAVAQLNGCDYTLSVAMVLGRHAGLTEQELNAARQLQSSDPKTAAALRFVAGLVRERGRVRAAEVEELRASGFTDEEIVEIIALVCLNIFRNYLNLVADTEIDFPVVRSNHAAGRHFSPVTGE